MPRRVEEQAIRAVNGRQTSRTDGKFRCGCAGETAQTPGWRAPTQTPEFVGQQRSTAPSSRRSRPSAHDSPRKPCASLRAAQIIATTSGRFLTLHAARQQEPSRRVRPAPTKVSRSVAQPPRISGRLRVDRVGRCRLARSLAPAQLARCLEGGGKGVSLVLGGSARLCSAHAGSASGTFRALDQPARTAGKWSPLTPSGYVLSPHSINW